MTLETLFQHTNSAFRGSDDDVPAAGTPDYTLWLNTTNRKIAEWARDSKNTWQSTFSFEKPTEPGTVATTGTTTLTGAGTYFTDYRVGDTVTVSGETVRTIATITSDTVLTVSVAFSNTASAKTFTHATVVATGVQSYSVHRSLLAPSDEVLVTTTDDADVSYVLGKPQERSRFVNEVYLSGRGPQTLTFYDDIESTSSIVGGTLRVPGYYLPDDLAETTDVIPVDDPYWLVAAVAANLAFNDLTYESKSADLQAQANALYKEMVGNNRRGSSGNPRTVRTSVTRIGS